MSEITPEERARLRWIIAERGIDQAEDRIILRLLNALEAAEARVKARDERICTLLREALESERNFDGMKSRWQTAEADITRRNKWVDWLAAELSGGCSTSRCIYHGATESCPLECGEHYAGHWKEAARKSVEGK